VLARVANDKHGHPVFQLAQASRETQSTATPTSVVVTALTSCLRGMVTILERDLDALLQRHGAVSTQQRAAVLQQLVVDCVVTPWAELNDDGEAERKVLDFQELPFEENSIAADEYRHAALQDGISIASDFGAPASVAPSIPSIPPQLSRPPNIFKRVQQTANPSAPFEAAEAPMISSAAAFGATTHTLTPARDSSYNAASHSHAVATTIEEAHRVNQNVETKNMQAALVRLKEYPVPTTDVSEVAQRVNDALLAQRMPQVADEVLERLLNEAGAVVPEVREAAKELLIQHGVIFRVSNTRNQMHASCRDSGKSEERGIQHGITPMALTQNESYHHAEMRKNAVSRLLGSGVIRGKRAEEIHNVLPSALEAVTQKLMTLYYAGKIRIIGGKALIAELSSIGTKSQQLRRHLVSLLIKTEVIKFQSIGTDGQITYSLLPESNPTWCEPPALPVVDSKTGANVNLREVGASSLGKVVTAKLLEHKRTTIHSHELSVVFTKSGVNSSRQRIIQYLILSGVLTAVSQPRSTLPRTNCQRC
jgi:hypothetical protein